MKEHEVRKVVREGYAKVARSCCCPPPENQRESCCEGSLEESERMWYTDEDREAIPEGSDLGLGCGNPVALASLREGEIVLDLGAGAGVDCFLAARKVGTKGRVIGVDMTPEMLDRARENAEKAGYTNVEFRLGEIEHLPVADSSVDVVISNCVINLSPSKEMVFQEAFRVLKPGGRLMISDMVLVGDLPENVKNSVEAHIACIAGASKREEYLHFIEEAGFTKISVLDETSFPIEMENATLQAAAEKLKVTREELERVLKSVVSMKVRGEKPA